MPNIIKNIDHKKAKQAGSHGGSLDPDDQANRPDPLFEAKLGRLKRALGAENPASLMKILGLSSGAWGSAEKRRQLPLKWIAQAFEEHGISSDWLISGEGPMRRPKAAAPVLDISSEAPPGSFSERLLWLISEKAGGKPPRFAKHTGVPYVALFSYIQGNTPDPDHLVRIRDAYVVNLDWLLNGKGDPFIRHSRGAGESKYEYNLPEPDLEDAPPASSRLDKIMALAKKVLSCSNPEAAEALEKNIRYFAHAVEVESRLALIEERMAALEELFITPTKNKNLKEES
jgi:hypothetical protein